MKVLMFLMVLTILGCSSPKTAWFDTPVVYANGRIYGVGGVLIGFEKGGAVRWKVDPEYLLGIDEDGRVADKILDMMIGRWVNEGE